MTTTVIRKATGLRAGARTAGGVCFSLHVWACVCLIEGTGPVAPTSAPVTGSDFWIWSTMSFLILSVWSMKLEGRVTVSPHHMALRGDMVILKSQNRAKQTIPPLKPPLRHVQNT
eukprot:5023692-Prymnesium_polylepis.1